MFCWNPLLLLWNISFKFDLVFYLNFDNLIPNNLTILTSLHIQVCLVSLWVIKTWCNLRCLVGWCAFWKIIIKCFIFNIVERLYECARYNPVFLVMMHHFLLKTYLNTFQLYSNTLWDLKIQPILFFKPSWKCS